MLRYSDQVNLDQEAEALKALASAVRLTILAWLKTPQDFVSRRAGDLSDDGGVCVSLIAERAQMSQPTVSRHLEVLRRAGLIYTRRDANWNFHYRDEDGIARVRDMLKDL